MHLASTADPGAVALSGILSIDVCIHQALEANPTVRAARFNLA